MGVRLVGEAMSYRVDVPLHANEYSLLIGMALTARDTDTPPRYFDSREAAALALGRRVPDAHRDDARCACADCRARSAAFEAVKVALRGLVALGAVERTKRARAGQRAEYSIVLDVGITRATDEYSRRQGKGEPSAVGRVSLPLKEGRAFQQGKGEPSPKEIQGSHTGDTAGTTSRNSTISLAPVDKSAGEAA